MLIKEWELENYKNKIGNFNAILLYGTDRGKVNFISESLIAYLKDFYKNKLEVIKPSYEKLNNNEISFLELVAQKSIFHDKTIVNINLDLTKINKEEIASLEKNISAGANLVIFESAALKNNSYVLKEFKKSNKFICVACYQDNARNITQSINYYAKSYGISLDNNITKALVSTAIMRDSSLLSENLNLFQTYIYEHSDSATFCEVLGDPFNDNNEQLLIGAYCRSADFEYSQSLLDSNDSDKLVEIANKLIKDPYSIEDLEAQILWHGVHLLPLN